MYKASLLLVVWWNFKPRKCKVDDLKKKTREQVFPLTITLIYLTNQNKSNKSRRKWLRTCFMKRWKAELNWNNGSQFWVVWSSPVIGLRTETATSRSMSARWKARKCIKQNWISLFSFLWKRKKSARKSPCLNFLPERGRRVKCFFVVSAHIP